MFKIRVDVKGFEKYTGLLGVVPFTNGISDREVTEQEASRLGAIMKMVRLDNDGQVGASTTMVNAGSVPATTKTLEVSVSPEAKREPETSVKYSREHLEKLAEKDGIKPIREIAKEYDVKGVQISKMIDEIVSAQLPKEA